MQVVHDRGMPLMKHAVHGFCGFVRLLVGVAVDVDECVLGPVRGRLARQCVAVSFALEIAVEPVDHFVPAVGIGNGIDQHNQLFPDPADHGLLRYDQAVRKFEHSLS